MLVLLKVFALNFLRRELRVVVVFGKLSWLLCGRSCQDSWEVCGMKEGKWSVESGLVRIVVVFDTPFLWVLGGFWEVLFSTRLLCGMFWEVCGRSM